GRAGRARRRTVRRGEERQRARAARAADVEPEHRGAGEKLRQHAVHAGGGQLAVTEALEHDREAVRKGARRQARERGRCDRVVAPGQQQRGHVTLERRVQVRIHRSVRPDAAHGLEPVELQRAEEGVGETRAVDGTQVIEGHILGTYHAVVHAGRERFAVAAFDEQELRGEGYVVLVRGGLIEQQRQERGVFRGVTGEAQHRRQVRAAEAEARRLAGGRIGPRHR